MSIAIGEREYIFNSMRNLLDTYGYKYTDEGIHSIIDEWYLQKSNLIEAFKKHPNYVAGKFMIAYDYDYERLLDRNGSRAFSNFLIDYVIPKSNFIENLPEEINKQREREDCSYLPDDLYSFLVGLYYYAEQSVSAGTAEIINEMIPSLKIRKGTKTSRAINKICTYLGYHKHENYNREFAKYADSLNPLIVRRHTILSVNPLDYLTMSFGNSWSSCHTIDKNNIRHTPNGYRGERSSGTVSYMLDNSSMVLYTVDKSYGGNDYWDQPKINRQMFHYGEDKLVQSRLYPQDNDSDGEAYTPYRNFVQEVISTIFDFPNLWSLQKGTKYTKECIVSSGTHYQDYIHYNNCTLSKIKDKENNNKIAVGAKPICVECGNRHDMYNNINCCQGTVVCAKCGCRIDRDDAYYIDGNYYCGDCCYWCDECEEYHVGNDTYIDKEDIYVCDSCLEKHFTKCEKCGEYVRTDSTIHIDEDDINICDDCCDEYYFYCYDCDEYHKNKDRVVLDNGITMCSKCYEKQQKYKLKNEEEA